MKSYADTERQDMKAAVLMLIVAGALTAQAQLLPQAPEVRPVHKFIDWKSSALLLGSAVAFSGDGLSTETCLNHPGFYEANPLDRMFVHSRPGAAFIFGAGFGAEIGGMYLAHKRGWHRVERWIPALTIAGESYFTVHNYRLIRR
jgi:hypothetical protein